MKKKELIERIAEGSPVVIGIPAGKNKIYVALDKRDILKSFKSVNGNANLPCDTVARGQKTREETKGWIVFFDVDGVRS